MDHLILRCSMQPDEVVSTIAESLWNEGHGSKALKLEEKDKEHKREMDTGKEKDRYKEKYWAKSIQELDLSSCRQCTPSYRLLPEDVRDFIFVCFCCSHIVNAHFLLYTRCKNPEQPLSLF